ncbi:MAG TPA: TolC family protein [Gammaproteobacteria bacterium]|nr:TolC family protein [Gammaproteobacteria bacterium]
MMFDVLLEAALRAAVIAAVAAAVLWALRVRAAAVRHRVWTVVMIAMLALPIAIAWAPDVSLRVLPPAHSAAPVAPEALAPLSNSFAAAVTATEPATAGTVALTPAPSPSWSWRAWLAAIYLAGAAALLARLAIGTVRVRLLAREAAVVNGELTSARIATPFTFGLLRPKILLPEGWQRWPAARLAVVLDHERAHVARRDPLVQWLALLNRAVFWFHPLAWWIERHLAALAEEACDAAVLARGHSPADYSEHLLELARPANHRPLPNLAGMPMLGSGLATRIPKILEGGIALPGSRSAAAGAAALATLAAAVLGTVTLAQEPALPRTQDLPSPVREQVEKFDSLPPEQQRALIRDLQRNLQPAQLQAVQQMLQGASRNLLEVYQLALANDPAVRSAEAAYRAATDARPQVQSAIALATADYEAARQQLLIRVAEPYFDVFAAARALALQEQDREALSRQLAQTQRRFDVGLVGVTDVQEAQGGYDQAVANALTAQRALATAQDALRNVVGEPVGELRPLVKDLPLQPPDPGNEEAWIETALKANPVLVSTRLRAESGEDDANARRAREDLERVARVIESETRAAYLGVVSEMSRVLALEQSVRSNEVALEATEAAFEVGTRSTVDVLRAQSTLSQSETVYERSRYDYALSVLRLRGAAGDLTAQGLEETKSWFD